MPIDLTEPSTPIHWPTLSALYAATPLGPKDPAKLETVFTHSLFKCFAFDGSRLVGAGRALADGADCSYICDVAVHPDHQGMGLGKRSSSG